MTIEAPLEVKFKLELYTLMVKMIRMENVNYFFIRDHEAGKPLLMGKILELTYKDSFSFTQFGGRLKVPEIPSDIVAAVETSLQEHQELWMV